MIDIVLSIDPEKIIFLDYSERENPIEFVSLEYDKDTKVVLYNDNSISEIGYFDRLMYNTLDDKFTISIKVKPEYIEHLRRCYKSYTIEYNLSGNLVTYINIITGEDNEEKKSDN